MLLSTPNCRVALANVPRTELTLRNNGLRQFGELPDPDAVLGGHSEHVLCALGEQWHRVLALLRHVDGAHSLPRSPHTFPGLQHVVRHLAAAVRVRLVPLERHRVLRDARHLQVPWGARLVCTGKCGI